MIEKGKLAIDPRARLEMMMDGERLHEDENMVNVEVEVEVEVDV